MRFVFFLFIFFIGADAWAGLEGYEPPSMFGESVPEPVFTPYEASPGFPFPIPRRKPEVKVSGENFGAAAPSGMSGKVPLPPERPERFYASRAFVEQARQREFGGKVRSTPAPMSGRDVLMLLDE